VVGFAAGGIPDWLQHGINGLLAPEADCETLGAHIECLLADPAFARKLGRQAARTVAECYRPAQFLKRIDQTLARAAAGQCGERAVP
jgi:glycosyltransferase involved in cell wall biosynthesis